MIVTERYADSRTLMLVHEFHDTQLLSDDSKPAFATALASADRRSSSRLAELLILLVAVVWSTLTTQYAVEIAGSSWEGTVTAGNATLSWAGETVRFLSNPLFLFLVLRWFWRFYVWTELLYRISRLRLQLSPMHPDGSAGLGFLAIYPGIFGGLAFALSSVIATSMLKDIELVQHGANTVWFALAVWLVAILIVFIGPLLVFTPVLLAVRDQATIEYGRLADQFHRAFHHKWIEEARSGEELIGSPDFSPVAGLSTNLQTARKLHMVPINRSAVIQLVIAAGVPLLAVVVREVPVVDIVKWIVGKIL
jgi:hypothetical protein